MVYISMGLP